MQMPQDLRYAFRMLRSRPLASAVAVFSLALGIGANTAVFSVADQVIFKNLPVRAPEELWSVAGGIRTYPEYREFRDRQRVFSGLAASSFLREAGLRVGSGGTDVVTVRLVSGNFFATMGAGAAAGRLLHQDDDRTPGAHPVAVIGYGLWNRKFARNPAVLGTRVSVNGYPLEIVGVADRRFYGIEAGKNTDLYVSIHMAGEVFPSMRQMWTSSGMHWLWVMGRLKPGVDPKQAQAAMNVLLPQVAEGIQARGYPELRGRAPSVDPVEVIPGAQGVPLLRTQLERPMLVLLILTGFVVLIACANVANILLAGASARRREIAIRLAVGASRWRLVRQLLTESAVLASLGGAAGLLLQIWIADSLAGLLSGGASRFALESTPNLRVLAFTALLSAFTGLVFGLAPAWHTARRSLAPAMRPEGVSETYRDSAARGLVALQVALSLILLVGAGLFARTLGSLRGVETGFNREHVLLVKAGAAEQGYADQRLRIFYDQLLERVRSQPGVSAASLALHTPLQGGWHTMMMVAEGYQPRRGENLEVNVNRVSGGFFAAMGIPILMGRDFLPDDEPAVTPAGTVLSRAVQGKPVPPAGRRVAIVSESLARRYFGREDPIGKRLCDSYPFRAKGALEIIGVVKDARFENVRKQAAGMVYLQSWTEGADDRVLAIRATSDPNSLIDAVRKDIQSLDPAVPLVQAITLEEQVDATLGNERMMAHLSAAFGLLALLLAAVGLYGVLAHGVARRTKEIGIRMALGADRRGVLRMVLRESGTVAAAGIALGLMGAVFAARLISSLLYGVAPLDPLTYAGAAGLLLVVALLAAWVPARRAASIDPMQALRYE